LRYPTSPEEVAGALARSVDRRTLILDGELTAFGGDRPSFALLQRRLHVARPAATRVAAVPVTFIALTCSSRQAAPCCLVPTSSAALLDGLALADEHVKLPPAFPAQRVP
jgi:bifunctional non-homologous end joining protein LigD